MEYLIRLRREDNTWASKTHSVRNKSLADGLAAGYTAVSTILHDTTGVKYILDLNYEPEVLYRNVLSTRIGDIMERNPIDGYNTWVLSVQDSGSTSYTLYKSNDIVFRSAIESVCEMFDILGSNVLYYYNAYSDSAADYGAQLIRQQTVNDLDDVDDNDNDPEYEEAPYGYKED